MKTRELAKRYSPIFAAYFIAFYTIPGFLVISGKKFDPELMIIALLYVVNGGVTLLATGYDTWKRGFCWVSIVLPVAMFFPSVYLFYGGATMVFLFNIGYALPAGVAAAFTQYVRMMHQRRRKF